MMKIAIVNDLKVAVEILKKVVQSVPEYAVAWIAENGEQAVEKCLESPPDIVLMDLIMPVMDGVEATRRIMRQCPCSILVVTATVEGNMSKVFEAMGCGALDAAQTPVIDKHGTIHGGDILIGKIATIGKLIGRVSPGHRPEQRHQQKLPPLAVIGASTGGPKAIASILSSLPAAFPAAIVIVQHVDSAFVKSFTQWLKSQTPLEVVLAGAGECMCPGKVYVAGTDNHLVISPDKRLNYSLEPLKTPYRPSVDAFLKSAATFWGNKGMAVLLTGMGNDGAKGLLELRSLGWFTVAQDSATSVVYGMPKAAVSAGAVAKVLPLDKIAGAMIHYFSPASRPGESEG